MGSLAYAGRRTDKARRSQRATFRSLRESNFRRFLTGQILSQNGTWFQLVAIDILVLEMTNSGTAVGLATAIRYFPILVIGPWAGVVADRSDRHRLLILVNSVGALVAGVYAVIVVVHWGLAWIFLLAAASGFVTAIEATARRSFVIDLVPPDLTSNAVALNNAMNTCAKVIGPAIAGVLIVWVGLSWCFILNALLFLPQIVLFLRIDRSRLQPSTPVERTKGQLREGFRYIWSEPRVRAPLLLIAAVGTLTFNYTTVFPLFATRSLAGGAGTYSLLMSVMAIGSLVGALLVARMHTVDARHLAVSSLVLGIASFALAPAPSVAVAAMLAVPVGISSMTLISGATSLVQLSAAPPMRGRVVAMVTVAWVGSTPVGGPIVGSVAEEFGARWAIALGGATATIAGLAMLKAVNAYRRKPPDTSDLSSDRQPMSVDP